MYHEFNLALRFVLSNWWCIMFILALTTSEMKLEITVKISLNNDITDGTTQHHCFHCNLKWGWQFFCLLCVCPFFFSCVFVIEHIAYKRYLCRIWFHSTCMERSYNPRLTLESAHIWFVSGLLAATESHESVTWSAMQVRCWGQVMWFDLGLFISVYPIMFSAILQPVTSLPVKVWANVYSQWTLLNVSPWG